MNELMTDKMIEKMITADPHFIANIPNPSEDMQLLAVKQDCNMIRLILRPTEKVQWYVYEENHWMWRIFSDKLCSSLQHHLIKIDPWNIINIVQPLGEEAQLELINQNISLYDCIKEPTKLAQKHYMMKKLAG